MLPNPLATNTWIKFMNTDSFFHDYRKGDKVLFMGWINNPGNGENAVVMDNRGVRLLDLSEDSWEIV